MITEKYSKLQISSSTPTLTQKRKVGSGMFFTWRAGNNWSILNNYDLICFYCAEKYVKINSLVFPNWMHHKMYLQLPSLLFGFSNVAILHAKFDLCIQLFLYLILSSRIVHEIRGSSVEKGNFGQANMGISNEYFRRKYNF